MGALQDRDKMDVELLRHIRELIERHGDENWTLREAKKRSEEAFNIIVGE